MACTLLAAMPNTLLLCNQWDGKDPFRLGGAVILGCWYSHQVDMGSAIYAMAWSWACRGLPGGGHLSWKYDFALGPVIEGLA